MLSNIRSNGHPTRLLPVPRPSKARKARADCKQVLWTGLCTPLWTAAAPSCVEGVEILWISAGDPTG